MLCMNTKVVVLSNSFVSTIITILFVLQSTSIMLVPYNSLAYVLRLAKSL